MQRISVVPAAECDAIWPHQFPAVRTVRTKDGSELVEKVLANRGGPQRPLSDDELRTKFTDNVSPWMDPEGVTLIAGIVEDPSRLGDLGALLAATVREG